MFHENLVGQFGSSEESDGTDRESVPVRSPLELRHCPSDITLTMEPCERSDVIEISWDEPIAASDTSEVTLISQNVQSGSVFHSGETTTVEYIFEDEFGQRVNCTFSVSVLRGKWRSNLHFKRKFRISGNGGLKVYDHQAIGITSPLTKKNPLIYKQNNKQTT